MKQTRLRFKWLDAGHCVHPEFVTLKGGSFSKVEFPSFFGIAEHPDFGIILYDTGYTPDFFEETKGFPEKIYALITPVSCQKVETAKSRLEAMGKSAADVKLVIISHFHGDHICGLRDFPNAKFVFSKSEWDGLKNRNRVSALSRGVLLKLIPEDILKRCLFYEDLEATSIPTELSEFSGAKDLIGDESLIIVPIPGHTHNQLGLWLKTETDQKVFIVADAVWSSKAIRGNTPPSFMAQLFMDSRQQYIEQIAKLHRLGVKNPEVKILPSHCKENLGIFA